MLQFINLLVDICLLRRGPQALPARSDLALGTVITYGVLAAGAEAWLGEADKAIAWSLLSMGLLVGIIHLLLRVRGFPERFAQTVTAIAGCGVIYLAVYLPITAAISAPGSEESVLAPILLLVWILVFFWGFIIEGSIYRHALNLPLPGGVLVSVLVFAAANLVYRQFFGPTP